MIFFNAYAMRILAFLEMLSDAHWVSDIYGGVDQVLQKHFLSNKAKSKLDRLKSMFSQIYYDNLLRAIVTEGDGMESIANSYFCCYKVVKKSRLIINNTSHTKTLSPLPYEPSLWEPSLLVVDCAAVVHCCCLAWRWLSVAAVSRGVAAVVHCCIASVAAVVHCCCVASIAWRCCCDASAAAASRPLLLFRGASAVLLCGASALILLHPNHPIIAITYR
ncbi:hypothetical protein RIF29_38690 [Crotalaria pallida]|uniref:Uncharacterized protein n=1 Tax=Crotalaria pallida TaxID=3830 RepID=A0AAN9E618_CROPI